MGSNIDEYYKYINKQQLMGKQQFEFKIEEKSDNICIHKYIGTNEDEIIIPSFVTCFDCFVFDRLKGKKHIIFMNNNIKIFYTTFVNSKLDELEISFLNGCDVTKLTTVLHTCFIDKLIINGMELKNLKSYNDVIKNCTIKDLVLNNCKLYENKNKEKWFSYSNVFIRLDNNKKVMMPYYKHD